MPRYSVQLLTSIDEIRQFSDPWDDLWCRSKVAAPTVRAELLAWHLEHFHKNDRVWCPVVIDDTGTALAALPMVQHKKAMFTCGGLPTNEWSGSGDLLLDESADIDSICDTLVSALRHAPWSLCWLEWIEYESPRWQALCRAVERQRGQVETKRAFEVGVIDTTGSWDDFRKTWSKNHRRNLKRFSKALSDHGAVSAPTEAALTPDEVEPHLREAFEVEDRNWKGDEGTSILQVDGMWEFYLRQAQQLAAWGDLRLTCLRVGDKPVAMVYGYLGKGVYHACKIGYDSDYHKQSPGNLLQLEFLQQAFADQSTTTVDFMGPIGRSCESWQPERYAIGSVMIAPGSFFGKAMLGAYRHVWPAVRRLRGQPQAA